MSVSRLVAILLPVVILAACGGGGAAAVAPQPLPDAPQPLPDALIADTQQLRTLVGGDVPPSNMTSMRIKQALRSIATVADTMLFSDIIEITELTLPRNSLTCSGTSCSGVLSDGTAVGYSLDNFGGIPDVGGGDLAGFNDQYSAVMIHEGVTLVQGRSAGRFDGRRYEFLNYAGWLANSVFAFQWELATPQGGSVDTISWLTSYSLGVATGTNPSGSGEATYLGAMVGLDAEGATIVQGRANLVVNLDASNINVTLSQIKNLETGNDVANMVWSEIPLSGGTFESTTNESSIEGNFYGDRHEEVGGIFDRDYILGAFGAIRQP